MFHIQSFKNYLADSLYLYKYTFLKVERKMFRATNYVFEKVRAIRDDISDRNLAESFKS